MQKMYVLTLVTFKLIINTSQFLLHKMPATSLNLLVFSFPKAYTAAKLAATVLKNNPPNRKLNARLKNGALYTVLTTVSVVTIAASYATSAAIAEAFSAASETVSARMAPVRSGMNSHADAAAAAAVFESRETVGRRHV
jgi:hypothetical protein